LAIECRDGAGRWRGSRSSSKGGRHGIHAAAGLRRKAPLAGDHVQLAPGAAAEEQGHTVSTRPADRRGDRGGDARHRRSPGGHALAADHRRVVARGLRISEALALNETDLDPDRGAVIVRHGKNDKRREVGMDRWAWSHLDPGMELRTELPVGRRFCIVRGPTRGRACTSTGIRAQLHQTSAIAGVRRRFAPHQLRTCSRCRDVARGDLAARDPETARACRPRYHVPIFARDRQHRDHRRRPRTPGTDDPRRPANRASSLSLMLEPNVCGRWRRATFAGADRLRLAEDGRSCSAVGGNRASYMRRAVHARRRDAVEFVHKQPRRAAVA
jgi:Phage integrase family